MTAENTGGASAPSIVSVTNAAVTRGGRYERGDELPASHPDAQELLSLGVALQRAWGAGWSGVGE